MKNIKILVAAFALFFGSTLQAQNKKIMEDKMDSVSYSLGMSIANNLKQNGIDTLNVDALTAGIQDVLKNADLKVQPAEAQKLVQDHVSKVQTQKQKEQQEAQRKMAESAKADGVKFLEENKTKEGVITTASGLQYKVIEMGTGAKPVDGQQVTVHYRGSTIDGNVFDESYKRGAPTSFGVNQVIPGWVEGLKLMPLGSTFQFFIPQELGYGARGAGRDIPPYAALIFTVELLEIK